MSPWLPHLTMGGRPADVPDEAWPGLLELARWEGLEGLVYARTQARGDAPRAVSIPETDSLQRAHERCAATNLASLSGLVEVQTAAGGAGLEMLVLPGATLLDLYPDVGCRPMDDVDLLVRPGDGPGLVRTLCQLGFRAAEPHGDVFVRDDCTVDVHADLVNGERIRARRLAGWLAVDEVWQRRRRWEVLPGCGAWAMSHQDELLYTAAHALRHSYRRLAWFCDMKLLLDQGVDWQETAARARRGRLERSLAYGLRFLEGAAPGGIPAGARAVAGLPLGRLEERLLMRLLRDRPAPALGEVLWSWSCANRVARLRFLAEFLFPRPEVLRQVFPGVPSSLMPLAYVLRLLQVCRRGGAALYEMAKG